MEIVFWKSPLGAFFRRHMGFTLADFLSVDIGPVETSQIPHTNIGRVDVEETMMA
jgi:hypothetical protein